MASFIAALTTLGSADDARRLVRTLVERRVVACGTILPGATSIYQWEGDIAETTEAMVVLKTQADRWSDLVSAVRELHPYDVPELIALPIEQGLSHYLDWIRGATAAEGRETE